MSIFADSIREIVSPNRIRRSTLLGGVVAAAVLILTPTASFADDWDEYNKYDERCNDTNLPAAETTKACEMGSEALKRGREHIDELLQQARLAAVESNQYDERCHDTNLPAAETTKACEMGSEALKRVGKLHGELARQTHLMVEATLREVSTSRRKIRMLQQASPQR